MKGFLDPVSAYARDVAVHAWWLFAVAAVVWLAVVIVLAAALRRPHPSAGESRAWLAIAAATGVTVIVLMSFMMYAFRLGRAHPQPHDPVHVADALRVTVIGRQWWWEFIYDDTVPERRLSTANELHVAVGVPVVLALRSPDVIHSAWVPRIAGKQDLTPGYISGLRFTADSAGVYMGVCAEFCGAQHANMRFNVVAHPPAEFERWRAHESSPAPPPTDSTRAEGEKIFMASTCAACHTVGGTDARGTVGPVLTHVGSRRTIAAGALPNTDENMARWIRDPQRIKPGVQMPASSLPDAQLRALVAYVRGLR